jgi:hypothetical protein
VADAEIYRLDAFIRWLDSADARIRRSPMPASEVVVPAAPRARRASVARR